jgi:opacity protein-like surface antigen
MRFFIAMAVCGALLPTVSHAAEERLAGFYIGGFAGAAVLDSTVELPATATTPAVKFVDQGGDGAIFGLRAGWGTMLSRHAYAGIEAEAIIPYEVTSRVMAMGIEYRARLRSEFGAYARLGWSPDGNTLLFLRGGLAVLEQSVTSTQHSDGTDVDWIIAPGFGVGAETHLTRNLLLRMDMTYTAPSGSNDLEVYRLTAGLAWRF